MFQKHRVVFYSATSMLHHVNSVGKSAFYHLRNIYRIRKLLSTKTTETLVHAFVTSKLELGNSLLHNVPKYVIKKLQSIQSAAAGVFSSSSKYDHITLIVFDLYWLPVSDRIKLKIILLTHKALHQQSLIYIFKTLTPLFNFKNAPVIFTEHYTWLLPTLISSRVALELLLFRHLNRGTWNYLMAFVPVTI